MILRSDHSNKILTPVSERISKCIVKPLLRKSHIDFYGWPISLTSECVRIPTRKRFSAGVPSTSIIRCRSDFSFNRMNDQMRLLSAGLLSDSRLRRLYTREYETLFGISNCHNSISFAFSSRIIRRWYSFQNKNGDIAEWSSCFLLLLTKYRKCTSSHRYKMNKFHIKLYIYLVNYFSDSILINLTKLL